VVLAPQALRQKIETGDDARDLGIKWRGRRGREGGNERKREKGGKDKLWVKSKVNVKFQKCQGRRLRTRNRVKSK